MDGWTDIRALIQVLSHALYKDLWFFFVDLCADESAVYAVYDVPCLPFANWSLKGRHFDLLLS